MGNKEIGQENYGQLLISPVSERSVERFFNECSGVSIDPGSGHLD